MEFRCRLASPTGEIVEGIYTSENETRLRHELEEKGLYVLSLQPRGRDRRAVAAAAPEVGHPDARVPGLQPGAGDAAQGRHAARAVARPARSAVSTRRCSGGCSTTCTTGSARARRCRKRSARTRRCCPSVYTASLLAGERSGSLDPVLRRFVEYTKIIETVKRKTISALIYPAILITLALVLVGIIVLKVVPAFTDFYATFDAELPLLTRGIVFVSAVRAASSTC